MFSANPSTFISVESRKGGVGKTTVALALAANLIEYGYAVLFLDTDLVGTRLQRDVVKRMGVQLEECILKGAPANLLTLYKDYYLKGKALPSLFSTPPSPNCGYFIGSDIYNNENKDGKRVEAGEIEDPRVLYDGFHAYWFLEFIKSIVDSFQKRFFDKPVVVVLDNSPGYSSIEKITHDFVTDLGINNGKILFVSSMDSQDVNACLDSVQDIRSQLQDKQNTAFYYDNLTKGEKTKKPKSKVSDLMWERITALDEDATKKVIDSFNNEITLTGLIGMVVNKVPRRLMKSRLDISSFSLSKNKRDIVSLIGDIEWIPFLEHASYQYYPQILFESLASSEDTDAVPSRFSRINPQEVSVSLSRKGFSAIWMALVSVDDEYSRFIDSGQTAFDGFFDSKWSPLSIFRDLFQDCSDEKLTSVGDFNSSHDSFMTYLNGSPEQLSAKSKEEEFVGTYLISIFDEKEKGKSILEQFSKIEARPVDGEDYSGVTESDSPATHEIPQFERLYSDYLSAVRQLKNVVNYCDALSLLMESFSRKKELIETLNLHDIRHLMHDIISTDQSKERLDELKESIKDEIFLRDVRLSTSNLLKRWELI